MYYHSVKGVILGILIFSVTSFVCANETDPYWLEGKKSYNSEHFIIASLAPYPHEQLSNQEREWYFKFQNGNLFFDGWKEICKKVLQKLPATEEKKTSLILESLGRRIGAEWAKNNSIRRIDNDHLRDWGERLSQAREVGGDHLTKTVESISMEVDRILLIDGH